MSRSGGELEGRKEEAEGRKAEREQEGVELRGRELE